MAVDTQDMRGHDALDPHADLVPGGPAPVATQERARGTGLCPETRAQGVQRVQIGLVGLAAMALLVGLANIIMTRAQQNQAQVVPEAAPTITVREPVVPVSDPLADMGVVPDLPAEAVRAEASEARAAQVGSGDALPPAR